MKASSSNPIIPGEELESWSSWSPEALDGFTQALTPVQLVALAQQRRASATTEAGALASSVDAEPEPAADPAGESAEEEAGIGYPTAAELEAIHQEAWQAGYEAGIEAGRAEGERQGLEQGREQGAAEGRAELQARFAESWAPLSQLSEAFAGQLARIEAELSADLLRLAWQIAEQLLEKQLLLDPAALEPVLEKALAQLPAQLATARLRVHPDDLAVAREFLQQEAPETVWQWMEDPSVARGGCIVDAPAARLDATLAARMAAVRRALGLELEPDERSD